MSVCGWGGWSEQGRRPARRSGWNPYKSRRGSLRSPGAASRKALSELVSNVAGRFGGHRCNQLSGPEAEERRTEHLEIALDAEAGADGAAPTPLRERGS